METNSQPPDDSAETAQNPPSGAAPVNPGADRLGPGESPPTTSPPPPGPFDATDTTETSDASGETERVINLQAGAPLESTGTGTEVEEGTLKTAKKAAPVEAGDEAATRAGDDDGADDADEATWQRRMAEVQAQAAAWEHARDRTLELEAQVAGQRQEVTDRLEAHDDRIAAMERRQAEAIDELNRLGEEVRAEIMLSSITSERRERFGDHAELRATVRTLLRRMSDGRAIDDDDRRQLLALGHRTGDHWLSDAGRAVVAWALGDEARGDAAAERAMSTDDQPARWFLAAVAFTQPDLADRRWETLARALERADPASSPVALDLAELALGDAAGSQGAVRAAELLTGWAGEPPGDPVRQDGWVRRVARTAGDVPERRFEHLEGLERWDDLRSALKALTVGEALSSRIDGQAADDRTAQPDSGGAALSDADGDLVARRHLLATIEALIDQPEPDEAELLAQELALRDQVGRTQETSRPRVPDLPDHDRLLWSLALEEPCPELGPRSTEVLRRTGRRWLASTLSEHLTVARSLLPDQVEVTIGPLEPLPLQRPGTVSPAVTKAADSDPDQATAGAPAPTADDPASASAPDEQLQLMLDEADGPEPTARAVGAIDAVGMIVAIVGVVLAITVTPWAWIAAGVGLALVVFGMIFRRRRAAQRRRQRAAAHAEAREEFATIWSDWQAYWARVDQAEAANAALMGRLTAQE